jgi:hypothetical protein
MAEGGFAALRLQPFPRQHNQKNLQKTDTYQQLKKCAPPGASAAAGCFERSSKLSPALKAGLSRKERKELFSSIYVYNNAIVIIMSFRI